MFKKNTCFHTLFLLLITGFNTANAVSCNDQVCEGYEIPNEVKQFINKGYEKVSVKNISGIKYLLVTTESYTNKCSLLFNIEGDKINPTPSKGKNEPICNISTPDGKVVSSWRDKSQWNDDIYQVDPKVGWTLLFRDSCVGCDQVKRTYFIDGKVSSSALLSDGNNFSERTPLIGKVSVTKANLYKEPNIDVKLKSYLIKGDKITLIDMPDDGLFYKIKYTSPSGKNTVQWINSDDFSLE